MRQHCGWQEELAQFPQGKPAIQVSFLHRRTLWGQHRSLCGELEHELSSAQGARPESGDRCSLDTRRKEDRQQLPDPTKELALPQKSLEPPGH